MYSFTDDGHFIMWSLRPFLGFHVISDSKCSVSLHFTFTVITFVYLNITFVTREILCKTITLSRFMKLKVGCDFRVSLLKPCALTQVFSITLAD